MKKNLLFSLVLIVVLTLIIGCEKKNNTDYMVLVNKQNKLPDDWEANVELVESTNKYGERQADYDYW